MVAFLGMRVSLLADAATFVASAVIIRTGVRTRPVPALPLRSDPQGRPAAPTPRAACQGFLADRMRGQPADCLRQPGHAHAHAVRLAMRVLRTSPGGGHTASQNHWRRRGHGRRDPGCPGIGLCGRCPRVQPLRRRHPADEVDRAAGDRGLRFASSLCRRSRHSRSVDDPCRLCAASELARRVGDAVVLRR